MDYFMRFFGFPRHDGEQSDYFRRRHNVPPHNDEDENPFRNDRQFPGPRGFNVFTDPLEMHQYFEQQMNEMFNSFRSGFQMFDNPEGFFHQFSSPGIEHGTQFPEQSEMDNGDLREQFLKKGYEKPSRYLTQGDKKDKDLDDRIKHGNLNTILDEHENQTKKIVPYNYSPQTFFSGQSVSIKTITNSDGSIETHRTVRDSQGNEETTVCKRMGDKEYCVTKKRDKTGKEEQIENFVNIDEKDTNFLTSKLPTNNPTSIFDKFFK